MVYRAAGCRGSALKNPPQGTYFIANIQGAGSVGCMDFGIVVGRSVGLWVAESSEMNAPCGAKHTKKGNEPKQSVPLYFISTSIRKKAYFIHALQPVPSKQWVQSLHFGRPIAFTKVSNLLNFNEVRPKR